MQYNKPIISPKHGSTGEVSSLRLEISGDWLQINQLLINAGLLLVDAMLFFVVSNLPRKPCCAVKKAMASSSAGSGGL